MTYNGPQKTPRSLMTALLSQKSFLVFIFVWLVSFHNVMARSLTLEQNTADIIKIGEDISEVFVANPDIADVQLNSPTVAYVFGKKPGTTTFFATDKEGKTTLEVTINVSHAISNLNHIMRQSFPDEKIQVYSSPTGLILKGDVSEARIMRDAENIAARYVANDGVIVNNLRLSTPTQVYLKVKVAEVNRSVLNQFDINWDAAFTSTNKFLFGLLSGARSPVNSATNATPTGNLFTRGDAGTRSFGVRFRDGTTDMAALIDALNQESLASVLAEPNLVAVSGQTASFLVGGEFPYPVPQDNKVTIEFKQFGTSLAFTPTVLAPDLIHLRVRPEVSELDTTNSITFSAGGANINVPAIKTRRAETSVELGSGQSLAIAGLISKQISNTIRAYPGLGELPILGALFRSPEFQREETELVIIVTPYVVKPTSQNALALPTDGLKHASNLEMIFFNRLNRVNSQEAERLKTMTLSGNAGFYID